MNIVRENIFELPEFRKGICSRTGGTGSVYVYQTWSHSRTGENIRIWKEKDIMKNSNKYERTYFMPPEVTYDWVKKEYVDKPPW